LTSELAQGLAVFLIQKRGQAEARSDQQASHIQAVVGFIKGFSSEVSTEQKSFLKRL
jgi:hypothetical protein